MNRARSNVFVLNVLGRFVPGSSTGVGVGNHQQGIQGSIAFGNVLRIGESVETTVERGLVRDGSPNDLVVLLGREGSTDMEGQSLRPGKDHPTKQLSTLPIVGQIGVPRSPLVSFPRMGMIAVLDPVRNLIVQLQERDGDGFRFLAHHESDRELSFVVWFVEKSGTRPGIGGNGQVPRRTLAQQHAGRSRRTRPRCSTAGLLLQLLLLDTQRFATHRTLGIAVQTVPKALFVEGVTTHGDPDGRRSVDAPPTKGAGLLLL